MKKMEREILQDIFTYFERFKRYNHRHAGIMMDLASELIMKNANHHLPEFMEKIRKDRDERSKKYN